MITSASAITVTQNPITSKASSQQTDIAIQVIAIPPILSISSPANKIYLYGDSILLDYEVYFADEIWYNVDNSNNITINGATSFDVFDGQHRLYLFANNSEGLTEESVMFRVNSTKLILIYDEYKGNKKGETNNFNRKTFEDLQNMDDLIIENTDFGKIRFAEEINLLDDATPDDNVIDMDSNIEISKNKIEINSENLPNLNKSAILMLYDLSFTTPRLLKDGSACPEEICQIISYTDGTLFFSVNHFTTYSAEEASDDTGYFAPSVGSSSGTHSEEVITAEEIVVEEEEIEVTKETQEEMVGSEKESFPESVISAIAEAPTQDKIAVTAIGSLIFVLVIIVMNMFGFSTIRMGSILRKRKK